MNNRIDIFVEGMKLDVDGLDLSITYSFSDLTDPLTITGDYSKSINLKGTTNNNSIFGQIWRLDRQLLTTSSEHNNVSVHFNASKRAKCQIYINYQLFKNGYLKLNKVKTKDGLITYETTFYSELCNLLHSLEELKLVDLNFPNNLQHTINRSNVIQFWNGTHELSPYMTYVMANNGLYENFDNAKMLTYNGLTPSIVDIADGIELDECAKGEYRSYYQRPALNIKGTIDQIITDFNGNNNDIKIYLDDNFFTDNNPYYSDSVITMAQYNTEESQETIINNNFEFTLPEPNSDVDIVTENLLYVIVRTEINDDTDMPAEGDIVKLCDTNGDELPIMFTITAYLKKGSTTVATTTYSYQCDEFRYDSNGRFRGLFNNIFTNYDPFYTYNDRLTYWPFKSRFTSLNLASGDYTIEYNGNTNLTNIKSIFSYFKNVDTGQESRGATLINVSCNANKNHNANIRFYPLYGTNYTNQFTGNAITVNYSNKIKSNSTITKKHVINDEITQADLLINYTKLFGLLWDSETTSDKTTFTIKDRNTFFSDYKILNWDNKIDYSHEIIQTPITFEEKYLTMNYEDGGTHYENYYKDKFDSSYGALKLNTGYEFNNSTKELFKNNLFTNTVMSNEKTKMFINGQYTFRQDQKTLPALFKLEDNARNQSDSKYNLLFNNGMFGIGDSIIVSDDDSYMFTDSEDGCWIDRSSELAMNSAEILNQYPKFSTLYNGFEYSWDIGYPRESYSIITRDQYTETSTIYNNFWRSYFNEIYNVDNKIVKCYVLLTPEDIMNFSFRNFVGAFGCIWHVNKINNYSPLGNGVTEVELIKVNNIDGYINGQKVFP